MIFTILLTVVSTKIGCSDSVHWKKPWENALFFEGDLIMPPGDASRENHTAQKQQFRGAVINENLLWPKGIIPYYIDKNLESKRSKIEDAMKHIESKTCIRFTERKNEIGYIHIISHEGCYSHFGRTGVYQFLSLGEGCYDRGTIIHELNHAVGFYHEHTRSDRDEYININYENIDPDFEDEFIKRLPQQNLLINDFDYSSIMMYGPRAFSKDNYSITIAPKKAGVKLLEIRDKFGLSPSDIFRINTLYKCKKLLNKVL